VKEREAFAPAGTAMTRPNASAGELLARHGLRPKKSWGQNFLCDRRAAQRIVEAAALEPDDVVVEIGAGLGALTRDLAAAAGKVIAVERDPDLVRVLREALADVPTLEIAAADALEFDFAAAARSANRSLVLVGNLPYQITSPLLFRVLDAAAGGTAIKRAVFMVQREVAERLNAGPGGKTYGRLSVMLQQLAEVRLLFHVAPGAFFPRPAVSSTVFCLAPRSAPRAALADPKIFQEVVRSAFGGRRKMLRRALEPAFGSQRLVSALDVAGVDGTRRGEQLSIEELAAIANALSASDPRIG
jgi:16S rRNA (adenine1518-N6/adenine1519-N6)-dimethyltransferase